LTIDQSGVGTQVTDGFVNMAYAMLVGIGLVYPNMVILVDLLLVPVVILFALLLAVIGAFLTLAVTSHALDLSALIGLLMLIDIVVRNAIVLLDMMPHRIEAGADVRTALIRSGLTLFKCLHVVTIGPSVQANRFFGHYWSNALTILRTARTQARGARTGGRSLCGSSRAPLREGA
jgi:hypothetical protein